MHESKRWIMSLLLAGELLFFSFTFFFGSHGIQALHELRKEITLLQGDIVILENEVDVLNADIIQWRENDFYREKMAREQLQMARKEETIYYIQ
ncbi:MAG: septum formation initiator family protein [Candidatus Dependentiae bacterium]|nr:septum formation initiator family protein [Candidatus Dependentiae bacterium]